jgi:DNA-binding CsgD family transcriptional regulator
MKVCHDCDNPPCCNPAHLFLGTQADNMADMARKGRANRISRLRGDAHPLRINPHLAARGERVGGSRLTETDVGLILSSSDSQRELARRFGVNRRTISFVLQRKTWRHIDGGKVVVR